MTEGNVSQAAKLAGKYRADFYELLKKHDLKVEEFKRMKTGMPNWEVPLAVFELLLALHF